MERDLEIKKARSCDRVNAGIQKRTHKKITKWKYLHRKQPYEGVGKHHLDLAIFGRGNLGGRSASQPSSSSQVRISSILSCLHKYQDSAPVLTKPRSIHVCIYQLFVLTNNAEFLFDQYFHALQINSV